MQAVNNFRSNVQFNPELLLWSKINLCEPFNQSKVKTLNSVSIHLVQICCPKSDLHIGELSLRVCYFYNLKLKGTPPYGPIFYELLVQWTQNFLFHLYRWTCHKWYIRIFEPWELLITIKGIRIIQYIRSILSSFVSYHLMFNILVSYKSSLFNLKMKISMNMIFLFCFLIIF